MNQEEYERSMLTLAAFLEQRTRGKSNQMIVGVVLVNLYGSAH